MGEGFLAENPEPFKPYCEVFAEQFPHYMCMGMTYDEYWNGSAEIVAYYRRKTKIEQERKNQEAWWQGLYTFYAISTAVGNLYREKGAEPKMYLEQPLPITNEEAQRREEEHAEKERERATEFFASWVGANKKES